MRKTFSWRTNTKEFDEAQSKIADMAVQAIKNRIRDQHDKMSDGDWLKKNYPEINVEYEKVLHKFGLL